MTEFISYGGRGAGRSALQLQEFKEQKILAIAGVISGLSGSLINAAKDLPKNGKRNPFRKTYNRRPGNKKKKALFMCQAILITRMAIIDMMRIQAQPFPRFRSGGAMVATVGSETIITSKFNS